MDDTAQHNIINPYFIELNSSGYQFVAKVSWLIFILYVIAVQNVVHGQVLIHEIFVIVSDDKERAPDCKPVTSLSTLFR